MNKKYILRQEVAEALQVLDNLQEIRELLDVNNNKDVSGYTGYEIIIIRQETPIIQKVILHFDFGDMVAKTSEFIVKQSRTFFVLSEASFDRKYIELEEVI